MYGLYNLTITGGNATIETFANMPNILVIIVAQGSNNITIENEGSGGIHLKGSGSPNKTMIPGNNDWIEFRVISGVIQEYSSHL